MGQEHGQPAAVPRAASPVLQNSRQYELHDRANMFFLPLLCGLCIGGLANFIDCYLVTLIFTGYIIFDFTWILLYPDSLPRYPHIILVHHVITLALLSHPLRFPEDSRFTCLDGLVELSTFCLVARRCCTVRCCNVSVETEGTALGWLSKLLNYGYWVGTIALRLGLQPYLLYWFWDATRRYDPVDRFIVMCSQTFLCIFNVGLVILALLARREHKRKTAEQAAKAKAAELKAQ